jgi:hypothetical protein
MKRHKGATPAVNLIGVWLQGVDDSHSLSLSLSLLLSLSNTEGTYSRITDLSLPPLRCQALGSSRSEEAEGKYPDLLQR